jgi:hypothetical protein
MCTPAEARDVTKCQPSDWLLEPVLQAEVPHQALKMKIPVQAYVQAA